MISAAIQVLRDLGLLTAIQAAATVILAVFIFRYFTDRS